MFLMIQTLGGEPIAANDVLVLKTDKVFGQIGAYGIDGKVVGYAAGDQPEGCLDMWTLISRIGDYRILCKVAVVLGSTLILSTDSPVLKPQPQYKRIEREGYAILSAK